MAVRLGRPARGGNGRWLGPVTVAMVQTPSAVKTPLSEHLCVWRAAVRLAIERYLNVDGAGRRRGGRFFGTVSPGSTLEARG